MQGMQHLSSLATVKCKPEARSCLDCKPVGICLALCAGAGEGGVLTAHVHVQVNLDDMGWGKREGRRIHGATVGVVIGG